MFQLEEELFKISSSTDIKQILYDQYYIKIIIILPDVLSIVHLESPLLWITHVYNLPLYHFLFEQDHQH